MFCTNCGAQIPDTAVFCTNCGTPVKKPDYKPEFEKSIDEAIAESAEAPKAEETVYTNATSSSSSYTYSNATTASSAGSAAGITPRNIAVAIILSIVTCGIYSIYWFIKLTDELNQITGSDDASGGVAFLLTLVTCGIYGWFWAVKMGQKVDIANGTPGGSTHILFIVLQIFGLGIINYGLAQDAINRHC